MGVRLGYLLPTREQVMAGQFEARPCWAWPAARRSRVSTHWVGDFLLARPRHDPLTLLAAVAARLPTVELGTAVLLPALRNPVLLAQQVATIDQIAEGRLILGVGIASDVPKSGRFPAAGVPFEKRVGRLWKASASAGPCGPARRSTGTGAGSWRGPCPRTDAASARWTTASGCRRPAGQPGARRQAFRRLATKRPKRAELGGAVAGGRGHRPHRRTRPRRNRRRHVSDLPSTLTPSVRTNGSMPIWPSTTADRPPKCARDRPAMPVRRRALRTGSEPTPRRGPSTSCCGSPASTSVTWRRWLTCAPTSPSPAP